ncbi:response regulator [Coleofasciculus sp. LEGE 07092]|nr:response regulator [Coleofasciculus sp. LEGE 07081]MBE9151591.1 response regulator [Coleofasciculus sp. LEGE 07092]
MAPPISTHELATPDDLINQILSSTNQQFTGRWDIENSQNQYWSLYFSDGLICGGSGIHPVRSWYRQLSRHCPQLISEAATQTLNCFQQLNYDSLAELVKQGKLPQAQVAVIIESCVTEILFDIIQQLQQNRYRSKLRLSYSQIHQDTIDSALVMTSAERIWRQAMQFWEAWQNAGLIDISPNVAPNILQVEELQRQTSLLSGGNLSALVDGIQLFKDLKGFQQQSSDTFYDNLITFADGNWTFRDLAVKLNRSLLLLAQQILPYTHQGLIGLIEVKDLSFTIELPLTSSPEYKRVTTPANSVQPKSTYPLIACIEDSQVDILIMNQVLTQAGYQFINIQDQEKALSQLISHKPDLIFLDLVMPIANGYEICAQIRRVPFFKDKPVVIVTGKDGIIDRARAKIVGASDFITKPISREKLLNVLQTYLPTLMPAQSQKQ